MELWQKRNELLPIRLAPHVVWWAGTLIIDEAPAVGDECYARRGRLREAGAVGVVTVAGRFSVDFAIRNGVSVLSHHGVADLPDSIAMEIVR